MHVGNYSTEGISFPVIKNIMISDQFKNPKNLAVGLFSRGI
jgi:hypothetical protein